MQFKVSCILLENYLLKMDFGVMKGLFRQDFNRHFINGLPVVF